MYQQLNDRKTHFPGYSLPSKSRNVIIISASLIFTEMTFTALWYNASTRSEGTQLQGGCPLRDHFRFNSSPRRQGILLFTETSCSANVYSADRILSRVSLSPFVSHSHAVIDLRNARRISYALSAVARDRTKYIRLLLVACNIQQDTFYPLHHIRHFII